MSFSLARLIFLRYHEAERFDSFFALNAELAIWFTAMSDNLGSAADDKPANLRIAAGPITVLSKFSPIAPQTTGFQSHLKQAILFPPGQTISLAGAGRRLTMTPNWLRLSKLCHTHSHMKSMRDRVSCGSRSFPHFTVCLSKLFRCVYGHLPNYDSQNED